MHRTRFPFAVRLIGFPEHEALAIGVHLAGAGRRPDAGCSYFRLEDDNLQDPDLFIVNADEPKAMVALNYLGPSNLRPALLVGATPPDSSHTSYSYVPKPIHAERLIPALDQLVGRRADALSRLEASDIVTVPERRRRDRSESDGTPADYAHLRRPPVNGGVVIVDKDAALADYMTELLSRRQVSVHWVADEIAAVALCRRQKVSLVMVNTSTPGIDPYRLCETIKRGVADRITVIFLVGTNFSYDQTRAHNTGCDGFLNKPLTSTLVVSVMKKFLPSLSR